MRNAVGLEDKQRWMRERNRPVAGSVTELDFLQRHYTVQQVAELWSLSPDAVRRLFEDEPGVLVLGSKSPRAKRNRYLTLRIPESVVERVYRRQLSR